MQRPWSVRSELCAHRVVSVEHTPRRIKPLPAQAWPRRSGQETTVALTALNSPRP